MYPEFGFIDSTRVYHYSPPTNYMGSGLGLTYHATTVHLVSYHARYRVGSGLTLHQHQHKRSPGLVDGLLAMER